MEALHQVLHSYTEPLPLFYVPRMTQERPHVDSTETNVDVDAHWHMKHFLFISMYTLLPLRAAWWSCCDLWGRTVLTGRCWSNTIISQTIFYCADTDQHPLSFLLALYFCFTKTHTDTLLFSVLVAEAPRPRSRRRRKKNGHINKRWENLRTKREK